MAGIYIHIPFCKQACHYCNFHFSTNLSSRDRMVEAILVEIDRRIDFLDGGDLETIYFGGGTPSVLSGDQISKILRRLEQQYTWQDGIEITLEANPDDLIKDKLSELIDAGVNRLSIGIQSFNKEDLVYMNRSHTDIQAHECITNAYDLGFQNLSLDLIFGIPNRTSEEWQDNLDRAISYNPSHLSCYNLTIEPKTAFDKWVKIGKIQDIDQEASAVQFLQAHQWLTDKGYDHYEISNYAFGEHLALHNTNYWRGIPYLGLGPSAHSFDGEKRYWNINNNAMYLSMIENGQLPIEGEILSKMDRYNEYVMTSLRTKWGCDLEHLDTIYPIEKTSFLSSIQAEIDRGFVIKIGNHYVLTPQGMLMADQIIGNLFCV